MPEEDLHLSDLARSQAHIPPASCRVVLQFPPNHPTTTASAIPPAQCRVVIQFQPSNGHEETDIHGFIRLPQFRPKNPGTRMSIGLISTTS